MRNNEGIFLQASPYCLTSGKESSVFLSEKNVLLWINFLEVEWHDSWEAKPPPHIQKEAALQLLALEKTRMGILLSIN